MRNWIVVALASALSVAFSAAALERQPGSDYRARRELLAGKADSGIVLMFASTEEEGQNSTRGFRQNDSFYYLTGWAEPGAALLIAPKTETRAYTEILFLPGRNVSQERWTGPKRVAETQGIARATGFDRVLPLDVMRDQLVDILPSPSVRILTDVSEDGPTPATVPIAWLRRANAFPNYVSFGDVKPLLAELRTVKDAGELALLRKAAAGTVEAHRAALKAVRPGVKENEIAALIEYEYRRRGAEAPAFSSIVGGGSNSTVLHYSENSGTLAAGDVVVMDVGGEYGMYASDVTRTLPVSGRFTPRQREIYNIVLGAQKAAVDAFKVGVSTFARTSEKSLYKVAMDYINAHGKDSKGQPLGQYFIHGLSHFVGLGVHDAGDASKPLTVGAVFTIEPGIYIPEEKIGIRIEDTYIVAPDGKLECISCGAPKTIEEIERAMGAS
jgi:Xaa-Pro aminopeptidase